MIEPTLRPMVGGDWELLVLGDALIDATCGDGRFAVVSGEIGMRSPR